MTPTRQQILRVLWQEPGLSTRGVARAVDLADATAGYHLNRLAKAGEIVVERVGRVAAHYPNGWGDAKARKYATLSVEARAVLAVLKDLGIARAAEVSRWSGLRLGATRHALELCEERGLVRRRAKRGFFEVVE